MRRLRTARRADVRETGRIFAIFAVFFTAVGIVYWILSNEPAGAAALVFTGGLGALIAFYMLFTAKRIPGLPEDDLEGDIASGAGEYGFFSPHSWWPLPIAAGSAITALGLCYLAWWLIILGLGVVMFGVTGLLFEYYRKDFAR
jgi:hypothetical protein